MVGGQENQEIFSSSDESPSKELFYEGIGAMCWGTGGYSLWGTSKTNFSEVNDKLFKVDLVKSSSAQNPSLHYYKNFLLHTADKILQIHKKSSFTNIQTHLSHLQLPQTYLTDNWP